MALLPTEDNLTNSSTTNAQQKVNFANLRNFIAAFLGTDSDDTSTAKAKLEIPNADDFVTIDGDQSIDDVKTFTSSPVVPDLTVGDTSSNAANAKLIADSIAAIPFASAAENAAGTVQGKNVDPLGIREAFNATGSAPVYACRAWVNFNGSGVIIVRASGNVTSVVDSAVGDFTVNFTIAMPDTNYAVAGSAYFVVGSSSSGYTISTPSTGTVVPGLSSYRFGVRRGSDNALVDADGVSLTFTR